MKLKKNYKRIKNNQSQLVLTFKTRDPGHESKTNPIDGKP
jgi:hypothetical protein